MHDEVILPLDGYLRNKKINPKKAQLQTRQEFISQVEEEFATTGMKSRHAQVKLSNGKYASISFFDIKYMILSLIYDYTLM